MVFIAMRSAGEMLWVQTQREEDSVSLSSQVLLFLKNLQASWSVPRPDSAVVWPSTVTTQPAARFLDTGTRALGAAGNASGIFCCSLLSSLRSEPGCPPVPST